MEYGLIGEKLSHSFSKDIHEHIGNYNYVLKELNEEEFIDFFSRKEFKAINVTIPYKEKVIPYLDYISESAKKINAVNTIVNKNGKLYGYNTDYLGFRQMLKYNNVNVKNKVVLILGTGGTSKTVSHVINDLKCKEIIFVSRNKKENCITYQDLNLIKNKVNIIINTTPCGMYPNNQDSLISLEGFSSLEACIDVIYNPLYSNFLLEAKRNNIKAINGLYMLVAQAFFASELFQDCKLNQNLIKRNYYRLLVKKSNLVLIGMPGSGKTTISKLLSKKMRRKMIDIDIEITKYLKMDIATFFKTHSEIEFREIETQFILKFAKKNHLIISCGGGVILNPINITYLKQNGIICYLDRDLEELECSKSRPLSSNKDQVKKLYLERKELYLKYQDFICKNDSTKEETCENIRRSFYEYFNN